MFRVSPEHALGVTPSRLSRLLDTPRPLLDYHLDRLEKNGMIDRDPGARYDRRKVAIRLTWRGGEALAVAARALGRWKATRERSPDDNAPRGREDR